jgi:glycine hydroxymethyltransferase
MKQAVTPAFKEYAKQVCANARALGEALKAKGYKLVTDGTENHLVLWDLRPIGLTGSKYEKVCDLLQYVLCDFCLFSAYKIYDKANIYYSYTNFLA